MFIVRMPFATPSTVVLIHCSAMQAVKSHVTWNEFYIEINVEAGTARLYMQGIAGIALHII